MTPGKNLSSPAASSVVLGVFGFFLQRLLLAFPLGKLPLTFLALIESDNVGQDATGNVLDLMLRNAGIVDELLPASQVVMLP